MGKWSGGCFGNLIEFENDHDHVGHCEISNSTSTSSKCKMPGLIGGNFSTRYHKLDDSIFILCQHCGHSVKTDEIRKMATYSGPTPTTRFRANSKHFLTWSATAAAANHKLQKLSKHFVNNVSKLQNKLPFQFQHHHNHNSHSQQQNSSDLSSEDSSDWEPPCMKNMLGRRFGENGHNENTNSSSSANLMANDSLLLNNNNNNGTTGNNGSSNKELTYNSNSRQNANEKSSLLVKSSVMVGVHVTNTFELGPFTGQHSRFPEINGHYNESDNNGNSSQSMISLGGATLPLTSPHWSRASSLSNSQPSPAGCDFDSPNNNVEHNNSSKLGHHHHHHQSFLAPESSGLRHGLGLSKNRESCTLNNKQKQSHSPSPSPHFSCGSSTGSNSNRSEASGSGTGTGASPSPVDDRLRLHSPIPIATSSSINNHKLTVTIFEEEAELKHAPWFQAGIPREIALEVLTNDPIGSFIVRESTTKSGCFALSMRVPREFQPRGIAHYLILKTGRGYKIKGFTKEFHSLVSLITHHSVMPELLPCPLSLYRYQPKYSRRRINSSDFVEPEKLIPLRKFTDF